MGLHAFRRLHTFEVKGGGRGGHFPKGLPGLKLAKWCCIKSPKYQITPPSSFLNCHNPTIGTFSKLKLSFCLKNKQAFTLPQSGVNPSSSQLSVFLHFWSFVTKTRVSRLANKFYKGAIFVYWPHFCYLIIYHPVFRNASLNHALPMFNHVFVQMWPRQKFPCSWID